MTEGLGKIITICLPINIYNKAGFTYAAGCMRNFLPGSVPVFLQ